VAGVLVVPGVAAKSTVPFVATVRGMPARVESGRVRAGAAGEPARRVRRFRMMRIPGLRGRLRVRRRVVIVAVMVLRVHVLALLQGA
jgi:hypothetical protein